MGKMSIIMCNVCARRKVALWAMVALLGGWGAVLGAQTPSAGKAAPTAKPTRSSVSGWTTPRTPWGDPDLQGIWTTIHFGRNVLLERPPALAGRFELTQEQADARFNRINEFAAYQGRLDSQGVGTYGREFRDAENLEELGIKQSRRTSQIIDPPDGRIPYTEEGRRRVKAQAEAASRPRPVHGVEDMPGPRCLPSVFPANMAPGGVDNGKQIVQSPGYVVIQYENGPPFVRVIPIGGQLTSTIPQWWGQPRGHWEGDTLVVETTQYNGRGSYRGSDGEHLRVVERFTRTGENEVDYTYTVDDPTTYMRPWTVGLNWLRYPGQFELVEYACSEGNYDLPVLLRIAQAETAMRGVYTPINDELTSPELQMLEIAAPARDTSNKDKSSTNKDKSSAVGEKKSGEAGLQ